MITNKPVIHPLFILVATLLVPPAALVYVFAPDPYDRLGGIVCVVSGLLAGVGLPQAHYSSPLIPAFLVPGALSLSGILVAFAQTLPSPLLQFACTTASAALAALAGKALPPPTKDP